MKNKWKTELINMNGAWKMVFALRIWNLSTSQTWIILNDFFARKQLFKKQKINWKLCSRFILDFNVCTICFLPVYFLAGRLLFSSKNPKSVSSFSIEISSVKNVFVQKNFLGLLYSVFYFMMIKHLFVLFK